MIKVKLNCVLGRSAPPAGGNVTCARSCVSLCRCLRSFEWIGDKYRLKMATVLDSRDKSGSKTSSQNTKSSDPVTHWGPRRPATPSRGSVLILCVTDGGFSDLFSPPVVNKEASWLRSSEPTPNPSDMIPNWDRRLAVVAWSLFVPVSPSFGSDPDRDVLSERLAAEAPLPPPERRAALSDRAQLATLLPVCAVWDSDQHLVQQGKNTTMRTLALFAKDRGWQHSGCGFEQLHQHLCSTGWETSNPRLFKSALG